MNILQWLYIFPSKNAFKNHKDKYSTKFPSVIVFVWKNTGIYMQWMTKDESKYSCTCICMHNTRHMKFFYCIYITSHTLEVPTVPTNYTCLMPVGCSTKQWRSTRSVPDSPEIKSNINGAWQELIANNWRMTLQHLSLIPVTFTAWFTLNHSRPLQRLKMLRIHEQVAISFQLFFTVTYYLPELKTILLTKCSWISINGNSWFGESNNSLHSLDASTSYLWCSCTWNLFNLTTLVMALLTFFTGSVVLTTTF